MNNDWVRFTHTGGYNQDPQTSSQHPWLNRTKTSRSPEYLTTTRRIDVSVHLQETYTKFPFDQPLFVAGNWNPPTFL